MLKFLRENSDPSDFVLEYLHCKLFLAPNVLWSRNVRRALEPHL